MEIASVSCRGPLTTDAPDSTVRTHKDFQGLVDKLDGFHPVDPGGRTARFDLSRCQQIDPGAVMLLMYAARSIDSLGYDPVVSARKNPSAAFDAVRMHVEHFFADRRERSKMPQFDGDYPLRGVWSHGEMVAELEGWAECIEKTTEVTAEEMALWSTHISELTTNSFQHGATRLEGKLGPVLIAGTANRRGRTVQLAVLDTGSGIPRVLRPHIVDEKDRHDGRIIREACRLRVTSRCDPANQGHGLPGLVDAVRRSTGTLQILSGNGMCHLVGGRLYSRRLQPLPNRPTFLEGTLAIITVKGSKWKS